MNLSELVEEPAFVQELFGWQDEHEVIVADWIPHAYEDLGAICQAPSSFGEVRVMKEVFSGQPVAVKTMPKQWACGSGAEFNVVQPKSVENPWNDVYFTRFLNSIGYPYVCRLHGVFLDDEHTRVVSDYASGGDLFGMCSKLAVAPGPDREKILRPIFRQVFDAVRILHDLGICHRDLSLENIVMTKVIGSIAEGCYSSKEGRVWKIKLIDFAQASSSRYSMGLTAGKRAYMAPECYTCQWHDAFLVDMFALGVALYGANLLEFPWDAKQGCLELLGVMGGSRPLQYLARRELQRSWPNMVDGKAATVGRTLSHSLLSLLDSLLSFVPLQRLTLRQAVSSKSKAAKPCRSVYDSRWLCNTPANDRPKGDVPRAKDTVADEP